MAETTERYRKLPGSVANPLGRTRVWEGSDHLLVVTSVAAFESYRRFYFREIKALLVLPTNTGKAWNAVLGVGLALCVVGALTFQWFTMQGEHGDFTPGVVIMGVLGAIIAVFLISNIAAGATCRVYAQTRAGVERLGAPGRVRAARRFRERIATKLRAAQEETTTGLEAPMAAALQ